jgi:hypothetical protein
MGCLESLPYEVLLSKISFKESREFLSRYQEKYDIEPGYRMFDLNILEFHQSELLWMEMH